MDYPNLDLEALESLTNPAEVEGVVPTLEKLTKDAEILLFVAEGCPACPHQVRSVATLALASSRISAEILNAREEPELVERYEVSAVPTTVVNDQLIMVGVIPAGELAWRILEAEGPEAERVVFGALVEAGRHGDAAERLSDGRATDIFLELWSRSTLESRMGLFLVVEEALEANPTALDHLVHPLIEGLRGDGPLTQDPTRVGDTADLLGQIGHPEARSILESLSRGDNPEVAEAASDALEELREG